MISVYAMSGGYLKSSLHVTNTYSEGIVDIELTRGYLCVNVMHPLSVLVSCVKYLYTGHSGTHCTPLVTC